MADTPNFEKSTLAYTLPWESGWVTALTFVGASRKIAAGNEHGQIVVWEVPEKAGETAPLPTRRLDGHTNYISRLLSTPDGKTLISASYDHTLRYWDLAAAAKGEDTIVLQTKKAQNKEPVPTLTHKVELQPAEKTLTGHKDWVQAVALSTDGNTLVSGDDKGVVIVWDRPAGTESRRWQLKGWAFAIALSPDAKLAAVAERIPLIFDSGRQAALRLWDVSTGQMVKDFSAQQGTRGEHFGAIAWSPDGKLLAVGQGNESNGKIYLLDAETGKKVQELAGHLSGVNELTFLDGGKQLLSTGRDTCLRVWQTSDGKKLAEVGKPRGGQFKDWYHAMSLSADQKYLAAADMAGAVAVYAVG
ncbi:MAG: PD40 domain-containing protein [Planctomycetia bacterium]|nr:PD40 domain-containing protein [Planctomycetia bacterium]